MQPGGGSRVVAAPLIPALGRQEQADLCDFKAGLQKEFYDSQGYTEKLRLKLKTKKEIH